MHYIGTKAECEQYNAQVTAGEHYSGGTVRWANIKEHPEQDLCAIQKHNDYTCDMGLAELSEDWNKEYKPTMENTKAEIKAYMDENGIEYNSSDLKADLLQKIEWHNN